MPKTNQKIFSPRFEGNRFKNHQLPIDVLVGLAAYKDALVAVVRQIWLEDHPNRERLPDHFGKDISFSLSEIKKGSAIPALQLIGPGNHATQEYSNLLSRGEAKIRETIEIAQSLPQNINQYADLDVLKYLSKLGSTLEEGEFIDFTPNSQSNTSPIRLNRKLSNKLKEAASKPAFSQREGISMGIISAMDHEEKKFTLTLPNGRRISGGYVSSQQEALFNLFSERGKVRVSGLMEFTARGWLRKIISLDEIDTVNTFDVPYRLEELKALKSGWFDGFQGRELRKEAVEWLSDIFTSHYADSLKLPATFPTIEGNIQMEWSIGNWEISLLIDLSTKKGTYEQLDIYTDEEVNWELDMKKGSSWEYLNKSISIVTE